MEEFANFIRSTASGACITKPDYTGLPCRVGVVTLRLRTNRDPKILDNAHEQQKVATGKEAEGWGHLRDQL